MVLDGKHVPVECKLGLSELGVTTFYASSHPSDLCGSNGLPLTPNSVKILGRSQFLKTIIHPHLCAVVDVKRGKHEQIIAVSEYYQLNVLNAQRYGVVWDITSITKLVYETLQGLSVLYEYGIVHRNLSPVNILLDQKCNVKLYNYGLFHMTGEGCDISFPIGNPKYTCSDVYLLQEKITVDRFPVSPNVDTWSLGIIMLELLFGKELWPNLKLVQTLRKVTSLIHCEGTVVTRIAQEHDCIQVLKDLPSEVKDFLEQCLSVIPSKRPKPRDLLDHELFKQHNFQLTCSVDKQFTGFPLVVIRSQHLPKPCTLMPKSASDETIWLPDYPGRKSLYANSCDKELGFTNYDHLSDRSIQEVYYLWQLAGGDLDTALKKHGLTKRKPPLLSVPNLILLEGQAFGNHKDRALLLDSTVVILSLDELRKRLMHIPVNAYYPLTETQLPLKDQAPVNTGDAASLPLIIRERDIVYQFHRVILFERLLRGYPYKRQAVWKEATHDVPPLYRARIWASLLEVEGDIVSVYEAIDKETPTPTDRQIEVDIPRCHQYDELLSSHVGHEKFKRILKAWVVGHPLYVYWQGLDSLCAPFLYLNFNDEALAHACLSAFIPKYLHNFFLKDNSAVIQEYLVKFSHLITFHDPELTNHLDSIGFIPELYAIPWFLTMFSHVFPLHKIFHLWDKLLLGDSSFPLCVGLAILLQLRDTLLSSGFNECILLFSDMPEVDIEKCVKDSIDIFCSVPKSATYRQHALPRKRDKELGQGDNSHKSQLQMDPIPLEELKSEKCPRICGADMIELLDLQRVKFTKSKTVIIDVRTHDEYVRGCIPTSLNIPYKSAFASDDSLNPCPEVSALNTAKGKIITVVGGDGRNAIVFAESLVKLRYPRVCTLHKGIDVLRSTNLIRMPRC